VAGQLAKIDRTLLSFSFPGYATGLGHAVAPAGKFASIRLFGHPAPVIFVSAFLAMGYYRARGKWKSPSLAAISGFAFNRTIPGFVSLAFLISTATVMMGSGMTESMAMGIGRLSGKAYTLFAPFVGITGAFITGSNTNSNVIFGALQQSIAGVLDFSPLHPSGSRDGRMPSTATSSPRSSPSACCWGR